MSREVYEKALALVKRGRVKLKDNSAFYLYFNVQSLTQDKEYFIQIKKRSESYVPRCTCESASMWGVGEICCHILSCKMWLKGRDLL